MTLKITELKKLLKEYDQKELIQLITELYKVNNDVKDYLSIKFLGEEAIEELFAKAAKKINNEFFPDKGHGKLRLSIAKKAITDFKKLTGDSKNTLALMLNYVELGTEFTNCYGDIDENFYNSMLLMYEKVVSKCSEDRELYSLFGDRLFNVVEMSEGIGWGYHDTLCDIYYSIDWNNED
jgi:hypothetical protein